MYQHETSGKWIFLAALLIAILAFAVGVKIDKAKWISPPISRAEARQMDAITERQTAIDGLDMQVYEAQTNLKIQELNQQAELSGIQHKLDIQQLEQQAQYEDLQRRKAFEHQVALNIQEIKARERRAQLGDILIIWSVAVGLMGLLVLAGAGAFKIIHTTPALRKAGVVSRRVASPWNSPDYRKEARQKARNRELLARQLGGIARYSPPVKLSRRDGRGLKWSELPLAAVDKEDDST